MKSDLGEWIVPLVIAVGTAVFFFDVRGAEPIDLVFIDPLIFFIATLLAIVLFKIVRNPSIKLADVVANKTMRSSILFIGLMLLLLIGLGWIGFFVSLFLFQVAAMWILGVREKISLLAVPLCVLVSVYLVFNQLLGLRFPVSPIGLF
jgi:hypothetical protein